MATPSVQDVRDIDTTGWSQTLDDPQVKTQIDIAESERNDIYSGQTSTRPAVEGNEKNFIRYLAAHKCELAEGGEVQSEGQGGSSTSYNTVTGDPVDTLQQTRYGREALKYVRMQQSTSVVRSQ